MKIGFSKRKDYKNKVFVFIASEFSERGEKSYSL